MIVHPGRSMAFAACAALMLIAAILLPVRAAMADPVLPIRTGAITDGADILSDADERNLAIWSAQTRQKSGTELVVVTLPSLQRQPIEVWGGALGHAWRIGGNSANGVVLIVAPDDREVRIEIGDGVSSELTNSMADSIIDDVILPEFRRGRLAAGTAAGVFAIAAALSPGAYVAPSAPQVERARPINQDLEEGPSWEKPKTIVFAVIAVVIMLGLILLSAVYQSLRHMFRRSAPSDDEILLDQEVGGPGAPVNYDSVVTHSRASRHTGVKFGGVRFFWGSGGAGGSWRSRGSSGSGGFSGSRGSSGSWGSSGRSSGGGFGGRGSSGKW